MYAVSPNFADSKLAAGKIEDKIDVFEDQMNGWLLAHAHSLASPAYPTSQHTGFAILTLVGSYFETIASYLQGASSEYQSAKFFAYGFRAVFPEFETQVVAKGLPDVDAELKRVADAYYKEIRCGLFHEAMTRTGTVVVKGAEYTLQVAEHPITKKLRLEIDPFHLLNRVQAHFNKYVAALRDPSETAIRENFEREWDRRTTA